MEQEKARRSTRKQKDKKIKLQKRKSNKIKEIEKYSKKSKFLLLILFLIILSFLIFPSKKKHIIRRYKYSVKRLNNLDKYNVKFRRKRDTYTETIKETTKSYDKYLNRLDINVLEYLDFKEDEKIIFFERNKKSIKEKNLKKSESDVSNLMYFPLISKEKKAKNIKYEKGNLDGKNVYVLKYKKDNLDCKLYIDINTYYPLQYVIDIPTMNLYGENKIKTVVYEYNISDKNIEEINAKNLNEQNYTLIENSEERLKYIDKRNEISFEGSL